MGERPSGTSSSALPSSRGLRPDIQGLRAVAVLSVLVWHAGLPLPGGFVGVDVFFVISGFLMTHLLFTELERTGTVSLRGFYARRARRLLPASLACLLGVLALTYALLPETRWRSTAGDVISSAGYFLNWRLAERSVDYLAEGAAASPVQHFWSLAVEEQFYLLWPLLLLAVGVFALRGGRGRHLRRDAALSLLAVAGASFAWSILLTRSEPERAYFVTTTRLWELALGGLVALHVGKQRRPWKPRRSVANAGAASGLLAIAGSLVLLDTGSAFPGWVAAVPTVGTAAVIAVGPFCGGGGDPVRLLAPRVVQWVGGLSYSLYLWHWPLLVVAAARSATGELSSATGALVIALSVLPAWLSLRLVEDPLRRLPPAASRRPALVRSGMVVGAWGTAVVVALSAGLIGWTSVLADRTPGPSVQALGAASLGDRPAADYQPVNHAAFLSPPVASAADDLFHAFYDRDCFDDGGAQLRTCVFGAPEGRTHVVLVGDSHAIMWLPALAEVAAQKGWRLEVMARTSCPLADTATLHRGRRNTACEAWNAKVLTALESRRPDLVLTTQSNAYRVPGADGDDSALFAAGLARTWGRLLGAGLRVATLMDGPRFDRSVVECVALHRDRLSACARPRSDVLDPGTSVQRGAARSAPGVEVVDLSDALCPGTVCPAVIGNVIVYVDTNHISNTYATSLVPRMAAALPDLSRPAPTSR